MLKSIAHKNITAVFAGICFLPSLRFDDEIPRSGDLWMVLFNFSHAWSDREDCQKRVIHRDTWRLEIEVRDFDLFGLNFLRDYFIESWLVLNFKIDLGKSAEINNLHAQWFSDLCLLIVHNMLLLYFNQFFLELPHTSLLRNIVFLRLIMCLFFQLSFLVVNPQKLLDR